MSNSLLQVHELIFNQISFIEPFGRSILVNDDNVNCQVQLAFKHKFLGFEQNLKSLAKSYENEGEARLTIQDLFPCIQHHVNTETLSIVGYNDNFNLKAMGYPLKSPFERMFNRPSFISVTKDDEIELASNFYVHTS